LLREVVGNLNVATAGFMMFEVCCGLFWPLMGMQRSETIPEDIRSTVLHVSYCSSFSISQHAPSQVMNLFRLPLNIFVVVVLSKERHPSLVLMICAAALAVASGLQVSPTPPPRPRPRPSALTPPPLPPPLTYITYNLPFSTCSPA
jgi:hypothetical protein